MADRAQSLGQVADPGTDVSAFAATDFERGMVWIELTEEARLMDLHRPGGRVPRPRLPGQVVGPLALDLDRGVGGGTWTMAPVKAGSADSISSFVGRLSEVAVTLPSASSLSRASPQQA